MKIHEPSTKEGFLLTIKRIIEDIESEKIREYQEKHDSK